MFIITARPDLASVLTVTSQDGTTRAGDTITYTVEVFNSGNTCVKNVVIRELLLGNELDCGEGRCCCSSFCYELCVPCPDYCSRGALGHQACGKVVGHVVVEARHRFNIRLRDATTSSKTVQKTRV